MVRVYKRPPVARNYKNYSNDNVLAAVEACRTNGMSVRTAAVTFGVPKSTLNDKLTGKHRKQPGRPWALTAEEEKVIVAHIVTMASWGFPLQMIDIRYVVKEYLDALGKNVNMFKGNFPGKEWGYSFLRRHQGDLTVRLCQNIATKRASITVESIQRYFDHLSDTLKDVPPDNIFNYDETNLSDDPKAVKVVCKRGLKYAERIMNSTKSSTSIMMCGSATGVLLPPYVVYKAEHLYDIWIEGGPIGCKYNRTKSGWFDSKCFEDWFEVTFLPNVRHLDGKKVLIGDNLSSHFSEKVMQLCRDNDIEFVCIPPASTHMCQPLDVAYFHPLKMVWRKILGDWKKKEGRFMASVPKRIFPKLLNLLMEGIEPKSAQNLRSGFVKSGIYPLNGLKVIERLPDADISSADASETSSVSSTVSRVLVDMLSQQRCPQVAQRVKKTRLQGSPGKSLSGKDVGRLVPPAKKTPKRRKMSSAAAATVESESDSDESVPEESESEGELEEIPIEPIETPSDLKVGGWLVVKYDLKRSTKFFIGQILGIEGVKNRAELQVKFLRRKYANGNTFVWKFPDDIDFVQESDVVRRLAEPNVIRREELLFQDDLSDLKIE